MSVLATSARGASVLIFFQLISRGFTFVVNQLLLRHLTPEILGLSAQLDLYARTVISFSRDSIEGAAQRQAGDSQPVVNISYLTVVVGAPLAILLASAYLNTDIAGLHNFAPALWIYAISCVVELLATPAYAVSQKHLLFKVRASAETVATILRCIATAFTAIISSQLGFQAGVLPFASGQFLFALGTIAVYYYNIIPIVRNGNFSLLPRKLAGSDAILGYIPYKLGQLSLSLFVQNAFKFVLTQGDGILVAALTSLADQGSYALAANYGGLIARMLFQPIEETTRTMFAQLCASPTTPDEKKSKSSADNAGVDSARLLLENVLKFYSIVGLVACTVGPTIAPILLGIVAGRRWSDTQAGAVLATYCYYIPLLAINGVTEGFVTAVASNKVLHLQSAMMALYFVAFGTSAWYFMRILDLGARGLVFANCVNMLLRIVFNFWFFTTYFTERKHAFRWSAITPSPLALAASVGTWSVLQSRPAERLTSALSRIAFDICVTGIYGIIMLLAERQFLLRWLQPLVQDRLRKRTA